MVQRSLMVLALLLAAAGCSDDTTSSPTGVPSSSPAASETNGGLQPAERITTLPTVDDGCTAVAPSTWESFGTMHTIVMATDGIVATIEADPGTVCAGGQTLLTMTFTNPGSVAVTIESPRAIISGGMDKWELAVLPSITVDPGATETRTVVGQVPLVAPADYGPFVYRYGGGSTLTVESPTGG